MNHALDGCFAKVDRAQEQINILLAELAKLKPAYSVTCSNEIAKQRFVFRVVGPSVPLRIPILTGEVIHQLRSVFDHIAWAFASRAGLTNPRSIYFPVADSPAAFKKARASEAMQAMPKAAVDIAERVQPYKANPRDNSTLGLLHHFDIVDKHRLPLVATYVAVVAEHRIALKGELTGDVTIIVAPDTFLFEGVEDGNHLFWLKYESPVPQPNLEADIKFSVDFALTGAGTYQHAPIGALLEQMGNFTLGCVREFAAVF